MVSWWQTYSYFNNQEIRIGDIELMDDAFGSSGSFGSRSLLTRSEERRVGYDRS